MKKLYYTCLSFFLLFFSVQSYSQTTYGWSEQNSGFTGNLWSISAVDSNVVWVGGDNLKVLRTTNGGINWTVISIDLSNLDVAYPIYNIFAIDANNAICTGSSSTYASVFKTTNGGTNWMPVFTEIGGFINNIYMFSNSNGFMSGDPVGGRLSFWKTTDGGNSWDSTGLYLSALSNELGVPNSIFVDSARVWIGSGIEYMYYSTDYGNSWTKISCIVSYIPDIWSNSANTGNLYIGAGEHLCSSTNFGYNWTLIPGTPGSGTFLGTTGFGSELFFSKYMGLSVYYSSNNGTSWITQYTVPSKTFSDLSKARTGKYIWGVRSAGGISRYGLVSGVTTISQNVPSGYKLYQNYPNPFNPKTKIKFDIKEKSAVTFKIYDIRGKEIATIINGELNAGSYEADFDASAFSSGVYFYILKTGNFTETKRMVYIK